MDIFLEKQVKSLPPEDVDIANKGKPKERYESLLIEAQNNAIRTNYVKIILKKGKKNNFMNISADKQAKYPTGRHG